MECVLSICFLVLFSFHLTRAAEHSVRIGLENIVNSSPEWSQSPVCSMKIDREIRRCAKDLVLFELYGFPWVVTDEAETQNQMGNRQKVRDGIQDPLDPINQICGLFQEFLKCLDQHAIPEVCLIAGTGEQFKYYTVFTFVCHIQPRSIDLFNSLSCLQENRVLNLMVFLLANKPGTHIDDMAQGTVNALFKFLNSDLLQSTFYINPEGATSVVSDGLICLPESVLSRESSFLIDSLCGKYTAHLARDYYLYFRRRYQYLLGKTGFPTNICDKETNGKLRRLHANEAHAVSGDARRDFLFSRLFYRFLDENSPGTALDTVYGRGLRNFIESRTDQEFCNPLILSISFEACTLLSYDPSGKTRFNVLHFAHSTLLRFEPFTDSSRMEIFRFC